MALYIRNRLTLTWLLLVIATVVSSWLGSGNGAESSRVHVWSALLVLLIAITKCRLVMRNYMEVRLAPAWLQLTCDAWLLFTFGMISFPHWLGLSNL